MGFAWAKGHGTQNDFVLLPDHDASVHGELDPGLVAALCDRRAGIGGDGVLRVVRTAAYAPAREVPGVAGGAEWFMDYRNADGSVAEMCGNGVRVFAEHLLRAGLVRPGEPVPVGTRGGVRVVHPAGPGCWTAEMGPAVLLAEPVEVSVRTAGGGVRRWPAVGVRAPNPHAVTFVDDLSDAGSLLEPPTVAAGDLFPDGVNVEFVVHRGPAHVALRVHERGAGETRSCGTGAAAVAAVAATADQAPPGTPYAVDVPGGRLDAVLSAAGDVRLTGPAVLVASGTVDDGWLARAVETT